MSPTRVGLIGLSTSTDPFAPGMWATHAHLPSILSSPHYQLTALCNSTVKSAQASIAHHNLPLTTKAYGSPSDLAQDPDVDLVVVSVQVGKHYTLTKSALLAGKDVFVEWPLGVTTAEAKELAELAQARDVRTIIGLQARASPLVAKIKEVLESGRIGKVMSTTVVATFAGIPVDRFPADATYYLDKDSGGNVLTVQVGHFLDNFTHLLGPPTTLTSLLATQYPTIALVSPTNEVSVPAHPKTAPDHVCLHGTLAPSSSADEHIIYSITFRSPPLGSASGDGMHWLITGTEGELEVVTPEMQWQFTPPGSTLKLRTKDSGGVEEIAYEGGGEPKHPKPVPFPGTNTGHLYEAFANAEKEKFADFGDAVVMHELLDRIRLDALQ